MYCPKCDMDFVDGVEICTDCGSKLIDKEMYLSAKRVAAEEKAAKLEAEKADELQKVQEAADKLREEYNNMSEEDKLAYAEREAALREMAYQPSTYVHEKDKYTDNKSSAVAFLIVGVLLAVLTVISWLDVLHLGLLFNIAVTVFAVLCLLIALLSNLKANKLKGNIEQEDNMEKSIIDSFVEIHTTDEIDAKVSTEDEFTEEESALEKLNIIQDMLTTENDIPDAAFAAEMAEEIYSRMYEANN